MRDRQPATGKGGRIAFAVENITVENGVLKIGDDDGVLYGIVAHADDAKISGSTYSKANVLPAAVTSALGLTDATAEPKDAFLALNNKITTASSNISKIDNITSGNFATIATRNFNAGNEDAAPDWRTESATNKTDLLVTVSAQTTGVRTLNIAVGSVVFSVEISAGTHTKNVRLTKSGNVWFAFWADGAFSWTSAANEPSYTVKADLNTQSVANGNVINSLSILGR